MIQYWNMALLDEIQTTTRKKYTWLDNCAFIGGNIDFVLILIRLFFTFYNYKLADLQNYLSLHTHMTATDGSKFT